MTNDAELMLCSMYKCYLSRRKTGISKSAAKLFGDIPALHDALVPGWSFEDTVETLRELHRADMIRAQYGDNTIILCALSDNGLIYMENRFANNVEKVLEVISTLRQILSP